uniref:Uncharacterized protein n=1 Tax=Ficedula albicollis TaxID=59894 RepID=A0A803VYF0_FICAL
MLCHVIPQWYFLAVDAIGMIILSNCRSGRAAVSEWPNEVRSSRADPLRAVPRRVGEGGSESCTVQPQLPRASSTRAAPEPTSAFPCRENSRAGLAEKGSTAGKRNVLCMHQIRTAYFYSSHFSVFATKCLISAGFATQHSISPGFATPCSISAGFATPHSISAGFATPCSISPGFATPCSISAGFATPHSISAGFATPCSISPGFATPCSISAGFATPHSISAGFATPCSISPGFATPCSISAGFATPHSISAGFATPCSISPGFATPCSISAGFATPHSISAGFATPCSISPGFATPCSISAGFATPHSISAGFATPCSTSPGFATPCSISAGFATPHSISAGFATPCSTSPGFATPCSISAVCHTVLNLTAAFCSQLSLCPLLPSAQTRHRAPLEQAQLQEVAGTGRAEHPKGTQPAQDFWGALSSGNPRETLQGDVPQGGPGAVQGQQPGRNSSAKHRSCSKAQELFQNKVCLERHCNPTPVPRAGTAHPGTPGTASGWS